MSDHHKQIRNLTETVNKLYEQVGQAEITPTMNGTPERRPWSRPARGGPTMQTSTLYSSQGAIDLWDISPKFQEMWDTYITAGGAWQKDVPWPGLPVFINPETGENVRFELPEPGEMQWPPNEEGPAFEYWASVLMWFVNESARGWPGGNAEWCQGGCHDSPLWRIWIQHGQPELSQIFINLMSAIGSNNPFWFLVMMGTNPTNNEPLSEGDNFYDEYVMFWDIFFGGQWGPGGED